ncbi:MAG TPA: hypothetical protein PKI44_03970, partial [Candidatus Omnitrophota bacterium]|nr:hypothetical protein [Candidatus Omnitrophota bacterium]
MDLAIICPVNYYHIFSQYSDFEMALAHLVVACDPYRNFLKNQSQAGKSIVLDNSSYELRRPVSPSDLFRAIELINPDEVVAPDKPGDTKSTVYSTLKFCDSITKMNTSLKIQAVVHGKDLKQILYCYQQFLREPRISTIGIPFGLRLRENLSLRKMKRVKFLNHLKNEGLVSKNKNYHCLGLNDFQEASLIKELGFVKRIDTSLPFLYAKKSIRYIPGSQYQKPKRWKNYFLSELSENELSYSLQNVK